MRLFFCKKEIEYFGIQYQFFSKSIGDRHYDTIRKVSIFRKRIL